MQYVAIKCEEKDGKTYYVVNSISLKNKNKSVVQKIPHPLGSDELRFNSLEEAKDAVLRAGFSYILPNGKKEIPVAVKKTNIANNSYEDVVLNAIRDKIDSTNLNVAASAILALSEFPCEETFEVLFQKIGEDNDLIRKNAISGICRYGKILQNRIIEALKSKNWVVRNSALICISNLLEVEDIDIEKFIIPVSEICNDSNSIVQAYALSVLAKVYQSYKKGKQV